MMMKSKASCFTIFAAVIAVALFAGAKEAEAQQKCNPLDLMTPCFAAFMGTKPTPQCCAKMKEQSTCICQYTKDPMYGQMFKNPGVKKAMEACQVTTQC